MVEATGASTDRITKYVRRKCKDCCLPDGKALLTQLCEDFLIAQIPLTERSTCKTIGADSYRSPRERLVCGSCWRDDWQTRKNSVRVIQCDIIQ